MSSERITVRVLLIFGDQAELVTPDHDHRDPLRVPAADIAGQAGLPANELPGREFTALRGPGGLYGYQLVNDPRV
ncbi:hypothetical protein ACFHW2_11935 [Actinomadura sp. LOL_016]|uniref:hypothetical protein n=1 Tax=unclassified Actinomadura TaxID=2626254 RepID=UPI003A7FCB19